MKKLTYILLFSIILFGCKPQKSIQEYKYITKTDTIIISQINTIYKGVSDTITIDNPCDSLGILNQFYAKISIPFGSVKISNVNGRIKAIVKTDSITTSNIQQKSKSTSDSVRTVSKETIKKVIDFRFVIGAFIIGLIVGVLISRRIFF